MMGASSCFIHALAFIHILFCSMASASYLVCVAFLLLYMNLQAVECASSLGNETDRVALLAIKDHITLDPLGALSSWNDTLPFCMWVGVRCSPHHQRVVILDLSSLNLVGSLSPFVGNLSFLRKMSFQENNFHGEIPKEIGRLFRLQHLNLSFNSFQGEILTYLTSCLDLRVLNLIYNKFVGNIPVNLDSLSKLRILWLNRNNFKGTIPPSLGNLSSLITLSLGDNSLQGSIPNNLGRLTNLRIFQVAVNNLSSEVPHSLYNISSINFFNVGSNQLHGSLPWDMGVTLPNLQYFWGGRNQFTGPLPITLSNASKLESFDVGHNNFVGPVVVNFRDLQNLIKLNLGGNRLGTGATNDLSFLSFLSNSSRLEILGLDTNTFGGTLPNSMVNLSSNLIILAMGRNHLTGCIPSGVENLVNLNALGLEGNFLTGTIPFSIGKLSKLQRLVLYRNRLQGEIPSSVGNISLLGILSLSYNGLWGRIPESLGNCRHLNVLDLARNNLSGIIPKQVVGLSSLSQILDLSNNFLIGSLPFEVGSLINLGALDISGNKLSGVIPSVLGNCLLLEYLYMNENNFKGNIPLSLSRLRGIQELDLSRNELSGQVPEYFGNFTFLRRLNLSFNDLNGEVPKEGVFKNVNDISVVGNKKLCGGIPELQLPNCTLNAFKERRGRGSLLKAIVLTISAILFSIIILSILVICWKRNSKEKSSFSLSMGNLHRKISYRELHKATNGFSSDSLIGSGSYGMVYKGTSDIDEKIFAVKVLKLENRGASKSFASECQILWNVRHRNLIKVLTVCSSVDFKGNDFHALVFEYMPNGNLDKWLHSKEDGENHLQNLSFMQRLSIAIEVALALEYLHHHCQIPIAHCDLKPGNILLDNDMSAHLGDFGLAKLLCKTANSFSHNHTGSIAIKGSLGYVPPEYGMGGEASTEGDVYSYGIMLLEMFTGKRPTDDMFKGGLSLHKFAKRAMPTQVIEIVDPPLLLEGNADSNNVNGRYHDQITRVNECLVSIVGIGIACSLESPGERMHMVDVVKRLVALRDPLLG